MNLRDLQTSSLRARHVAQLAHEAVARLTAALMLATLEASAADEHVEHAERRLAEGVARVAAGPAPRPRQAAIIPFPRRAARPAETIEPLRVLERVR